MGGRSRNGASTSSAKIVAQSNQAIEEARSAARGDRLRYLLALAPMFRHFIHPEQLADAGVTLPEEKKSTSKNKTGRTRMTEEAEDKLMLDAANSGSSLLEFQTTRLTKQPANIKNGTMRPYQIEGLNFLIGLFERSLNGILADEMGLGKTLQTISILAFLKQYKNISGPHIVIVPKSTLGNWMNEFGKWFPDANVVRFHGNAEQRKELSENRVKILDFDVVATTYEMVMKERSMFTKISWRYLVIDEAHRIKNENSMLSQAVRQFKTQARLLITGTPLQNNLHELWALLNFLLPDVFSRSEDFDEWFASVETVGVEKDNEDRKKELVQQLHAVLRPFLIRRLKTEVEKSLPPKKETVLYLKMSEKQLELYKNILKKDVAAISGKGGDRVQLLNILMQLRKCVNHPYLFSGVEDRTLDPFGEHLIKNCGKLSFLDRLLRRLQENGHRVLIFSQMTRVLDILEDYCTMRRYEFCRIDGQTEGDLRDTQIADFNKEGSSKFIFLLSTRAGGLGINLATADTVILFDSDWNAQVDLQAMDRAHRIGQKKPVNVYRLITEDSVEDKILRVAMAKLRLDTVVIQQGRLTEQKKNLNKNDLLDAIRYGADKFFKSNLDLTDEDLDVILTRGEAKTKEMNEEIEKKVGDGASGLDALNFSHDAEYKGLYDFGGVNYKDKEQVASSVFTLDIGKRTRVKSYDESQFFRDQTRSGQASNVKDNKFQLLKYSRDPTLNDYMLVNVARYKEINALGRAAVDKFNEDAEKSLKDGVDVTTKLPDPSSLLNPALRAERNAIIKQAFRNWNRRDFSNFVRAMERHGRQNLDKIVPELGGTKTLEEVKAYAVKFWELGPSCIENWPKVFKNIVDGEQRIARRKEMEKALRIKVGRYKDPWKELDVVYNGSKSKTFVDDEDRWLICMTERLGYGRWDDIKVEVRRSWQFRFDWFLRSRTPTELKRRVDSLIRLIERENEEIAAADKVLLKRKEAQRKRMARDPNAAGQSKTTKKRKTEQANLNAYFRTKPNPNLSNNHANGGPASSANTTANGIVMHANGNSNAIPTSMLGVNSAVTTNGNMSNHGPRR